MKRRKTKIRGPFIQSWHRFLPNSQGDFVNYRIDDMTVDFTAKQRQTIITQGVGIRFENMRMKLVTKSRDIEEQR
jgi:hypothetical protein